MDNVDVFGRDPDLLGDDLGERGFVALALGLHTQTYNSLAGGVNPQFTAVGHAEAEDVHVLARAGTDRFGEEADADSHQFAAGPFLYLLLAQVFVTDHLHRFAHGRLVVAAVVDPAGLGFVGELVGLDEILQPELGRVHLEFVGQDVDHAFDQIHRLSDAERTGIGDTPGRFVGVHGVHVAIGGFDVVAAGEDTEEPGRVLDRCRRAVEGSVVGQDVGADRSDLAVLGGGDLAAHDVVAGESGAHEILGAVLHPFHRLAGDDGGNDRTHVAGVDRHLVAEAAADVGSDDANLVLGETRHQGVDGAVGVGGLRITPEGQLAADLVHVGDAAACLHRSGMNPGVDDVFGDDHIGVGEHGLGGLFVAGFPIEAVVVLLALEIISDQGGVGIEGLAHVDDRIQWLVVDVDQFQRIACGVPVFSHDEGNLLMLEANLVGGENGLHVVGEGRHPCQIEGLQGGTGDNRFDLGMSLGGGGVDAVDLGVSKRAAQDREVQHARQLHIVDELAGAPNQAGIFLTEHAAEADRLLVVQVVVGGGDLVGVLCDGHAGVPSRETAVSRSLAAAHWMERMMVE